MSEGSIVVVGGDGVVLVVVSKCLKEYIKKSVEIGVSERFVVVGVVVVVVQVYCSFIKCSLDCDWTEC